MVKIRSTSRSRVISFVKIISGSSKSECGRVVDISGRGMKVQSKHPFQSERPYQFSIMVPNINYRKKVIEFDASVVWSKKSKKEGYFDAGLEIESVTDDDLSIIEQFIKDSSDRERWIQVNECFTQEH